ncbi:Kinesin-like protein KIN-10C [Bienertia sinuspersici]
MGSNGGRVRIVARIRSDLSKEGENFDDVSNSKPWVSVSRPDPETNPNSRSSRVKISFGSDQTSSGKQGYEVDECYEQEMKTQVIFLKEMKPLISGLFKGHNSTVFAYGPRGSGKTYTIQVRLRVDAILPQAEEQGKVVTVSVFEVYQDRVSDLFDVARPEVSVFEDAQGKIRLKGLSKIKVTSTLEFQRLYLQATSMRKLQSHTGCIVHVVTPQIEKSNAQLVGKINFIDLASYEDSRRKSSEGFNLAEATRVNKSLYAVQNVLYALNAKEARVPYRESKVTRMLQDSLGGTSRILMITCMNPSHCQETIQTINLASRSCMAGFLASLDPGKSSRSATKTLGMSSPQVMKSASKFNMKPSMMSPKVVKPASASAGKIQPGSKSHSHSHMSMKKAKNVPIEAKGRVLFPNRANTNNSKKSELGNKRTENASAQREVSLSLASETASSSTQQEEKSVTSAALEMDSSPLQSEEAKSSQNNCSDINSSLIPSQQDVPPVVDSIVPASFTYQTPPTENFYIEDKENKSSFLNSGAEASPPLSARLRELSNNLKSLSFSTEANLKMAQDSSNLVDQVIHENFEAETPKLLMEANDKHVIHDNSEFKTPVKSCVRFNENHEMLNLASPWESFHMRSSGMKVSVSLFLNIVGIGDKRATYILEMREESPEPFKQIQGMMKNVAGELFI